MGDPDTRDSLDPVPPTDIGAENSYLDRIDPRIEGGEAEEIASEIHATDDDQLDQHEHGFEDDDGYYSGGGDA